MKRVFILLFLSILLIPTLVSAKTLQEYYDQLADLEAQYNKNMMAPSHWL